MILALMAATVLAAPHAHRAPRPPVSFPFVGAVVSRDESDGPTLIGAEVGGHAGHLGIRASLSGGDGVTRTAFDALYFHCGKSVIPYAGVGVIHDCVESRASAPVVGAPPRHEEPAPKDPPSVLVGLQGAGRTVPYIEGRYVFGDADHGTVAIGIRARF